MATPGADLLQEHRWPVRVTSTTWRGDDFSRAATQGGLLGFLLLSATDATSSWGLPFPLPAHSSPSILSLSSSCSLSVGSEGLLPSCFARRPLLLTYGMVVLPTPSSSNPLLSLCSPAPPSSSLPLRGNRSGVGERPVIPGRTLADEDPTRLAEAPAALAEVGATAVGAGASAADEVALGIATDEDEPCPQAAPASPVCWNFAGSTRALGGLHDIPDTPSLFVMSRA